MDNKLSELSKPVAYKFDHGVMGPGDFKYGTPQMHSAAKDENASPLYSQEYVSALLAELEAKDEQNKLLMREIEHGKKLRVNMQNNADSLSERIAELERANQSQDDHINQQQDRIDSLEKTNAGLGRRLGDAEKRLATPVQLQNCDFESVAIMAHWCTDEQLKAWVKGVEHAKKQIRAAGFTVEGDE